MIGFSTNCFNQTSVPYHERIRLNTELGCRAIELGFVGEDLRFQDARSAARQGLIDDFDWVSLHGPGSDMVLDDSPRSHEIFDAIEKIHRIHPLDLVVFHPDNIREEAIFDRYTFPVGVENMDKHKASFQRPDTLAPLLARHPDWKLVVDINHCLTNDPTLHLAQEFFTTFRERVAEIHISGYQKSHEPLFKTRQCSILEALRGTTVPIIIESELSSAEEARKENEYIKQTLRRYS